MNINTVVIDVEPIFIQRKQMQEEFTNSSSNDEGFSSEPQSQGNNSVVTHIIKEVDVNEGVAEIKDHEQEEYRTEDDVEDPNYVLYEEQETEDDLPSITEGNNRLFENNFSTERNIEPIVSIYIISIHNTTLDY